jgi:hypothetical protein
VSNLKLLIIYKEMRDAMNIRTNVKAGGSSYQHNEKIASDNKAKSFTVKTGIRAGRIVGGNHNEKLADDNSRSIEQKKSIGKKLRLNKETIRELKDVDLKRIAGGEVASGLGCNIDDPFIRRTRLC